MCSPLACWTRNQQSASDRWGHTKPALEYMIRHWRFVRSLSAQHGARGAWSCYAPARGYCGASKIPRIFVGSSLRVRR